MPLVRNSFFLSVLRISVAIGFLLLGFRMIATGTEGYFFLLWNLFLAAIPYGAGMIGFLIGRLSTWERVILVAAGCAMAFPGHLSDALGLAMFLLVLGRQWAARRRSQLRPAR